MSTIDDADTHTTPPRPPIADQRPVTYSAHGQERVDEYAWLRAENWREVMQDPSVLDADIRAHLEAEDAYAKAWMADTKALQDRLFTEMRGRIQEADTSVPAPDGPFAYYTRTREWNTETGEGQYSVMCRKRWDADTKTAVGDEHILFDGDAEGRGAKFFDVGGIAHSPDHKLLAYAVDRKGSERYDIRVRDLETGAELPDVITDTSGDFEWAGDSRTLFWVEQDENNRPARVHRRTLGGDDVLVYEEKDPGFFVGVGATDTERFILITTSNHTTTEVWLIPSNAPETAPRVVAARQQDLEYALTDQGDQFLILTNADGAIDFKLCTAPVDAPGPENWSDWIPHRPGVLVLGMRAFSGHIVRLERENALPRLVITDIAQGLTGPEHIIALDEDAYSLGLSGQYEYDTAELRFGYSSPTTPDQVFNYDMSTRARTLLKTRPVPSGHEPSDYVAARITAPGHDGAEIPVTILRHKTTPLDGSAPLLLYGYGSYGAAMPAGFSTNRLSLVDRGVVFAIAHIRGGMEKGYHWYLDGKREKKTNTFKDYIASAEALIDAGYTARGNILAMGGSAGGLLVGAVLNMAPDLFSGALAAVPFVDVLTTMSDADLPLTPPEWPEWGNPIENADDYATIAAYSPYDNVASQAYPPILITAGLTDRRVTYWEPAKWAARLRARSTSAAPVLMKINMDAGHGGASARFDALKELAFEYAFALKTAGVSD